MKQLFRPVKATPGGTGTCLTSSFHVIFKIFYKYLLFHMSFAILAQPVRLVVGVIETN